MRKSKILATFKYVQITMFSYIIILPMTERNISWFWSPWFCTPKIVFFTFKCIILINPDISKTLAVALFFFIRLNYFSDKVDLLILPHSWKDHLPSVLSKLFVPLKTEHNFMDAWLFGVVKKLGDDLLYAFFQINEYFLKHSFTHSFNKESQRACLVSSSVSDTRDGTKI